MKPHRVVLFFLAMLTIVTVSMLPYLEARSLAAKLEPTFRKFTQVTTKTHPNQGARELEIARVLEEAKTTIEEASFFSNCNATITAHNPRTTYRRDILRVGCSFLGKPSGEELFRALEYDHQKRTILRY